MDITNVAFCNSVSRSPAHPKFHVFCVYSTQVVVHMPLETVEIETRKLEMKSEQMHANQEIHHFYSFH